MPTHASIKYASLAALTAQSSLLGFLLQGSAAGGYNPAAVVLGTEVFKGLASYIVSVSVISKTHTLSSASFGTRLRMSMKEAVSNVFTADSWKIAVPAALFVASNNLAFVGAKHLDLPTFQVTYNLKILTTALLSVGVLRKRLRIGQWVALCLLVAGVAVVQSAASATKAVSSANKQPQVGLLAILVACTTSSFASVYFELVLKGSQTDLWSRNVQMSFFSLLPALATGLVSSKPLFMNFGRKAVTIVVAQALNGLLTAVVIKYADNILKGFASALAVIVATIIGAFYFGLTFNWVFIAGACLVMLATLLYASQDRPPATTVSLALGKVDVKQ